MSRFVASLWRGDVPLASAFWEYTIVYGLLVNAVATMGAMMLFSADEPLIGLIVHVLPTPYNFLMLVAVWRSAGKYRGRAEWATAAKVAAVILFPITLVA